MIFLSKNLKYLRSLNKLSQEEFGKSIGLNRGNIASYEKGTAEPKMENLLKIAIFFNIDVKKLISTDLELTDHIGDEAYEGNELFMQLKNKAETYKTIIEGFKAYRLLKVENNKFEEEISPEDYSRMLEVTESLLEHHLEVLEIIKNQ